jgi:hypothetical protein
MDEINNWDITNNFWQVNPHFKAIELYNLIYLNDKTKDKINSSTLMWGIAFFSSFSSKFNNLEENERKNLISKDILKDIKFDWKNEEIVKLINGWDVFKTPSMKLMTEWKRLINEKTIFLRTLTYDAANADTIEKLLSSNSKLYKEYDDIMTRLSQESSGGTMKSGSMESLSEKGEI